MTPNQWKQLVQKKVNITIDIEVMEKCSQKGKLQDIAGDEVGLKQYWKYLTWENARTEFEVRTNTLRLNANYGQNDKIYYKCGKQETTKHIFECEDSTDDKISRESYRDMIRKAGPKQDIVQLCKTVG